MSQESSGTFPSKSHKFNKDLKEKVALLNSLLESATEHSIIASDLDGVILTWNEGAHRIFGYGPEEVVDIQKIFILQDLLDVKSIKIKKLLEEVSQKGEWSGELDCLKKDGTQFTTFFAITLRMDSRGKTIGYTFISRNLTALQDELKSLKQSKEYNRSLIESNMDILITTDTLGVINDVNQQICDITEFPREKLVGSPFKHFFTDPFRAEDAIRRVLSENRITNYELIVKSRTDKLTPVSFNATTFRSEDGKLKGIFATARDITEQKRLEEKALTQNMALKLRMTFTYF